MDMNRQELILNSLTFIPMRAEFRVKYTTSNLIAINLQERQSEQRIEEAIVYHQ